MTEEAAQYLIRLGIEGLVRVRYANGLTPNERSEKLVREVRTDNDNILQWIEDQTLDATWFNEQVIAECYGRYKDWCETGGLRPFSKSKFTRKVNTTYGFESVTAKRDYANGKKTVRVFRSKE